MTMKVYEVEIELKSLTTVTYRRTERNFISFTDHIPASTLRGALLSSLYLHGTLTKERLLKEATEPKLISSPAYPMVDGEKFYPTHPFVAECKECKVEKKPKEVFSYLTAAVKKILQGNPEKAFRTQCDNNHMALKPQHPGVFGSLKGKLTTHKVTSGINIAVGISKHRGSSMKGMLYGYESIIAGQKFWATVATPEDIKLPQKMKIWLGRGKSRGFGESELVSIKEVKLDDRVDEVTALVKRSNKLALYAFSKLLYCGDSTRQAPYPTEINLDIIASRAGLPKSGAHLTVTSVLGKTSPLFWGGWDMVKNESRPTLREAAEPGGVAIAKLECTDVKEAAHALLTLEYLGTVEHALSSPLTGVNMLSVLKTHPVAKLS